MLPPRAATTSSTTPTGRWTSQLRRRRAHADHAGADEDPGPGAGSGAGPDAAAACGRAARTGRTDCLTLDAARAVGRTPPGRPRAGPAVGSAPCATVLITGCSTGIGRATAARLAAGDWTVYATARRPETLADLEAAGCRVLALDVTDEASMRAAVDAVEGGVGVLINNAGYSQSGALETLPMDSVRRQFETNVFGAAADVPARPARDAGGRRGQDRQRVARWAGG